MTCAPLAVPSAKYHRFYLLDALRGFLAFLVVFRHVPEYLTSAVQTRDIFLAVDFFFCLSGFVIAFAYEERLRTRLCLRDFIAARLIRFYPMFLIGTVLAFASAVGPGHLLGEPAGRTMALGALPSLLFLPSISAFPRSALFPLNMACWTLLLELLANLAYAALLRGKQAVNSMLALVCIVSWLALVLSSRSLDSGSTWSGVGVGLARMGFSFPIGICIFKLWKRTSFGGFRQQRGLPAAALLLTLLLAVLLLPIPFSGTRAYQIIVMTFVLPGIVLFGADIQLRGTWNKACAALGDLSYPLYVVHLPLLAPLFGSHVARFAHTSGTLVRCLVPVYMLLLAAAAWALERYLDAPSRRWLSRHYNQSMKSSVAHPRTITTQPLTQS